MLKSMKVKRQTTHFKSKMIKGKKKYIKKNPKCYQHRHQNTKDKASNRSITIQNSTARKTLPMKDWNPNQ